MSRPFGSLVALAAVVLSTCLSSPSGAAPAVSFEEKLLISIPADHVKPVLNKGGFAPNSLIVLNRTGTQAAYSASKDGKNFVVVGKDKGPDFEGDITSLLLSDDGKIVVYAVTPRNGAKAYYINHKRLGEETMQVKVVAARDLLLFDADTGRVAAIMQQGGKEFALLDGKKGPEFEGNTIFIPVFSSDARRFAYIVKPSGKPSFTMIDDKKGPESNFTDRPVFSPDGSRVAFPISGSMVVDDVAGAKFENASRFTASVGIPTFSADGKSFAHWASHKGKEFVVVNGKQGPGFEKAALDGRIVFSPDGKRVAYSAKEGAMAVVVVDDKPGEPFDAVSDIRFSPDGKRLVFKATLGDKAFIVDNGAHGPKFDKVSVFNQTFGPDSATHAYMVGMLDKKSTFVVNGKAGEPFFNTVPFAPVISPDGKKIAYSVNQQKPGDNKAWVVINDKPGEVYDSVSGAFFSPDSSSVAYIAAKGGKQFLVLNGKPGPECTSARSIVFSPDSKKVAYVASTGNEIWWKVLDVAKP